MFFFHQFGTVGSGALSIGKNRDKTEILGKFILIDYNEILWFLSFIQILIKA